MTDNININICKHCGQVVMPGCVCDCAGAQMEARTEMQKVKAHEAIDALFGDHSRSEGYEPVSEDELITLKKLADHVAERKLISATALLGGGVKAKFVRGSEGRVKIERSESKKSQTEIGYWSN